MTPQELKASILQLAIQGKLVEQRPEEGTGAELLEKILAAKGVKGANDAGKILTRRRGERGGQDLLSSHASCPESSHVVANIFAPATLPSKNISAHSAAPREEISDDEKPFDIPESWVWVRLGEVTSIERGSGIKRSETSQEGFPCVRYGEIYTSYDYSFTSTKSFVPESVAASCHTANHGDVLCTLTGEWKEEIAKATAYLGNEPIAIGGDLAKISSVAFNPVLLVYFFFAPFMIQQKASKANGTMIVHIGKDAICNLLIPLPPLAEQKRIVAKIEELLPYIDRYEKAWSKLEDFNKRFPGDMQKSLLQMAIQGKLVDQRPEEGTGEELLEKILSAKNAEDAKKNLTRRRGDRGAGLPSKNISAHSAPPREEIPDSEKPFDIPESWVWVRLGEIVLDVSTGPFGSMLHKADYCDGGIPLVNPMNIQEGRIVPSDKMRVSKKTAERLSSYRLSEGMVVVARRGELGRCASVGKDQDGWLCGTGSFFLNPSKELFVPFITLIISSPYARQLFAGKAVGTTMANLNHSLLKALPFPLPPFAEQKRIVAKLEELLPLCERLK